MNPLRIVVLIDEQTPAHWSNGLVSALRATLSVPAEVETWIATDARPASTPAGAAVLGVLADALVGIDQRLRDAKRPSPRTGKGSGTDAAHGAVARRIGGAAGVHGGPDRWTGPHDPPPAPIDVMISTLPGTRELAASGPLGPTALLWAECEGHVLGGSAHGFLRALADERWTIDIAVCCAHRDRASRPLLQSRCAVRSISPSLNEELLAARVCELLALCAEAVTAEPLPTVPADEVETPSGLRPPAPVTVPPIEARTLFRAAARRVSTFWRTGDGPLQWALGYRRTSGESVEESFRRLPETEFLIPPPGTIWADVFPVHAEGCDVLFFEQEVKREGKGHIAAAELLPDGRLGPVQRVIEAPTHMSYPAVFRHEGIWFMVPESRKAGRVPLYRATDFPFRWEWERDLLSSRYLADATLFQRDGRWWMLAGRVGAGASTFEDMVGHWADSLDGPWQPISGLPLVSDATAGRPAGHVLDTASGLLRPAQDGSRRYGYGLTLRRVTRLTTNEFAEEEYLRVTPSWRPELRGIHTFNRNATLTCIDVLRSVR